MPPTSAGSDRRSRLAELSCQSPLVNSELDGHDREWRALLVLCRGQGNRLVVHLADDAPPRDAGLVEALNDGGPVHLVSAGERVDG